MPRLICGVIMREVDVDVKCPFCEESLWELEADVTEVRLYPIRLGEGDEYETIVWGHSEAVGGAIKTEIACPYCHTRLFIFGDESNKFVSGIVGAFLLRGEVPDTYAMFP